MDSLDVYLCNRLVGSLDRLDNGTLSFRYLSDYLTIYHNIARGIHARLRQLAQ